MRIETIAEWLDLKVRDPNPNSDREGPDQVASFDIEEDPRDALKRLINNQ
ncbi:MAG: hypothetical protein ABIH35_00590 [Patescibacteria group bacterium]